MGTMNAYPVNPVPYLCEENVYNYLVNLSVIQDRDESIHQTKDHDKLSTFMFLR